ncbi:sterile20-like kinase isoform b-related [Anaeramoeba flamelloides]|uniref:non-specific serine/threonine protein kinase n=1 Tax=Anaeramoeba flamelloides TaxID=1746091 RepID=A0AAV7YJE1_9EUKA|nr:sterile20-like kinase isoform b-related [Anaeramoeba flamelloides]
MGLENYEIKEIIGVGSFAKVYRAVHKKTNKQVALKIVKLDKQNRKHLKMTLKEISILASCRSPQILKYIESFLDGDRLYIVTELMLATLTEIRETVGTFKDSKALGYLFHEIVKGLDYIHNEKVIHRDIKPENIMVNELGDVVIVDFGISTSIESCLDENNKDNFAGTLHYLSPEIVCGKSYNEKVDIWSFGIVGYQMVTGKPPHHGQDNVNVINLIEKKDAPYLVATGGSSKEYRNFVNKCLIKNPEKRPTTKDLLKTKFLKKGKKSSFLKIISKYQTLTKNNNKIIHFTTSSEEEESELSDVEKSDVEEENDENDSEAENKENINKKEKKKGWKF